MKVFKGRFFGTGKEVISLQQATEWIECCFENVLIDDTGYNLECLKGCYFENVKFASGVERIGVTSNYFYPSPSPSFPKIEILKRNERRECSEDQNK